MGIRIPNIPLGEYALEVITSPHISLTRRRKNSICRQITPITQEAFPDRKVTEKEIRERTTDPSISTLYLIKSIDSHGHQIIGYLSTKAPTPRTVHICASVISKEHRGAGFYPLTKNIARSLEYLKRRFAGDRPEYVSAQTQFLGILNDLARDGILPIHLHPEQGKELNEEAERVADGLGLHEGFDKAKSVRRGAFKELGRLEKKAHTPVETGKPTDTGKKDRPATKLEEQLRQAIAQLDVENGDAILSMGRYTPEERKNLTVFEDYVEASVRKSVLAELLLGEKSKSIREAKVNLGGRSPHIRIRFKRGHLDLAAMKEGIAEALASKNNPLNNMWRQMHTQAKQQIRNPQEFREMFEKERGMQLAVFGKHLSTVNPDELGFTLDPAGLELLRIAKNSLRTAKRGPPG